MFKNKTTNLCVSTFVQARSYCRDENKYSFLDGLLKIIDIEENLIKFYTNSTVCIACMKYT